MSNQKPATPADLLSALTQENQGFDIPRPSEYLPLQPIGKQPIHPGAVVHCPKFTFQMTQAAGYCDKCEYFNGLALMNPAGEQALAERARWDEVYCIRCAYPIERKTHIINVITP